MGELTTNERVLVGLCVVAGTLGIVVGYLTPSTGTNILKDFLILISGGGIAYIFAMVGGRASAGQRIRSLCNRSVQRLGLTASHARDASKMIKAQASGGNETLLVLATQLDSLAEEAEVSIGDLEEMAGGKISLDPLVADAMQHIEAAVERVLPGDQPGVKARILSAIAAPLRKLEADVKEASIPVRGTSHNCPQCSAPLTTVVGESQGSTVHMACPRCGSRMTVHRMPDGGLLSRLITPKMKISCPSCDADIAVKVNPDDPEVIVRNCFRCDERIYINVAKGTIDHSEKRPPLETTYVVEEGRAVISCPSCMNDIRVLHDPAHPTMKVSCVRCTNLIRAVSAATEREHVA